MSGPTRSCVKCGGPCRHVLCDRCYEATPHSREPIAISRRRIYADAGVGLPVTVEGVRRFA